MTNHYCIYSRRESEKDFKLTNVLKDHSGFTQVNKLSQAYVFLHETPEKLETICKKMSENFPDIYWEYRKIDYASELEKNGL